MPKPMTHLLEEVAREHFPYPPATPAELEAFEERVAGNWIPTCGAHEKDKCQVAVGTT